MSDPPTTLPSAVATPPAPGVAAANQSTPLNQPAPPAYPDWLLQTDIGATPFNYSFGSEPAQTTRLFRLRNAFGQDQSGGEWSNSIAYLLMLAAQRELWSMFLQDYDPKFDASKDVFPNQSVFAAYCGTGIKSDEYLRAKHPGAAHGSGSALDIEYTRSPFIPMHKDSGVEIIYDASSYYLSRADAVALANRCVALWDKICGGRSPNCSFALNVSEGLLAPWIDQMVAFNTKIVAWFAPGGQATSDDIATFKAATPIGNTIYKPGMSAGGTFNPSNVTSDNSTRDPAQGILGFSKDLALGVLGAKISDVSDIAEFADPTLQSTLANYSFQWAPFIFGPDLQHFDITRVGPGFGMTHPPTSHIILAQQAIQKALAARPNADQSNNGPWRPAST